jgi:CRP-like cAMP-binding protein
MIKKLLKFLFIDKDLKQDIEFLKTVSLFEHLSDRVLAKIALLIFKKQYQVGERVFQANEDSKIVYIVREGQIKISKNETQKTLTSACVFGEPCIIGEKKHIASASALIPSCLYLLYEVPLNDLMDSDPKTGFQIMKNLNKTNFYSAYGEMKYGK